MQKIFSYGTLQLESVQLSTFGRKLEGSPDKLRGYRRSILKITNPDVVATSGIAEHPVIIHTGDPEDVVEGMVFDISVAELARSDHYESADYQRISVQLESKTDAWVYVRK